MDGSNQPASSSTRQLRSIIKLTPNAPSVIALAAKRRNRRHHSEIQEMSSTPAVAKRKKRKPKGVQKDNSGLEEAPGPVKTRNACFNPTADRSCENSPTYEAGSLQVASPEAKDPEGDPLKSMTQVTDEEATVIEPHPATPSPAQRTTYTPPLGPQAATSRASRPAEKSDICLDLAEPSPPSVPPSPLLEATEVQSPRVSQCGDWEEGLREELQSTSEAGHPANSTAQPSCPVITTEDTDFPGTPIPAVPARFSDKWTRITSLLDTTYRDSGMNLIIAASKDLVHGDGDALYLHTAGLDPFEFLQRLESCFGHIHANGAYNTGDNSVAQAERAPDTEERDKLGNGEGDSEAGILKELKSLLIKAAGRAGFSILDGNGRLMWATIEDAMAKEGVYLDNYPYVLMPHEKRQTKGKGIQNLRPSERKLLILALRSEVHRCQFVRLPSERKSDIEHSKHPLIIFAPPSPANGFHEQGTPYFKDTKTEQMGLSPISTELASSEEDPEENDTFDHRDLAPITVEQKSEAKARALFVQGYKGGRSARHKRRKIGGELASSEEDPDEKDTFGHRDLAPVTVEQKSEAKARALFVQGYKGSRSTRYKLRKIGGDPGFGPGGSVWATST